jgi:hypothetical protein
MSVSDTTYRATVLLAKILIAPHLGHGRATEFLLAGFAGSYGLALLIYPELGWGSSALRDLFWRGEGQYVSISLVVKSILTGWGLLANIKDWPHEKELRLSGAFLGAIVWAWFFLQFNTNDSPGAFGAFASFWFFIFSIRIMGMAFLGLPIPGNSGRL